MKKSYVLPAISLSVVLVAGACASDANDDAVSEETTTSAVTTEVAETWDVDASSEDATFQEAGRGPGQGGGHGAGQGAGQGGGHGAGAESGHDAAGEQAALEEQLAAFPVAELTEAEEEGLMYMREEEKLAGDVYDAMYELWGMQIFDNISAAETMHTDSMKMLLDRYELDDPAAGLAPGEFANPELQALYDELVATGSQSLTDALLVGALIEDVDIFDLQNLESDNPDIDLIYSNLEQGSRNHMRAFVSQLENNGMEYTPTYLTQEQFDEIISTPMEMGSGH